MILNRNRQRLLILREISAQGIDYYAYVMKLALEVALKALLE